MCRQCLYFEPKVSFAQASVCAGELLTCFGRLTEVEDQQAYWVSSAAASLSRRQMRPMQRLRQMWTKQLELRWKNPRCGLRHLHRHLPQRPKP